MQKLRETKEFKIGAGVILLIMYIIAVIYAYNAFNTQEHLQEKFIKSQEKAKAIEEIVESSVYEGEGLDLRGIPKNKFSYSVTTIDGKFTYKISDKEDSDYKATIILNDEYKVISKTFNRRSTESYEEFLKYGKESVPLVAGCILLFFAGVAGCIALITYLIKFVIWCIKFCLKKRK